jgi:hypothetical protein
LGKQTRQRVDQANVTSCSAGRQGSSHETVNVWGLVVTVDGETCGSAAGRGGVIGLRNASRCIKFKDSIKMD